MILHSSFNTDLFNMKYFLSFLSALLLMVTGLFAQSQSDLDALKTMLNNEKYQLFMENDPEKAAEYAYMNRHGYHVSRSGEKDFVEYRDVFDLEAVYPNEPPMTLGLFVSNEWNMYAYGIQPDKAAYKYFRIGETGKVLTILPEALAKKKMNQENKQK